MFLIETKNLRLQLEIVPVESLLLHEEVIPHHADKLILEFRNWANLQNPIIVDENHMVLDGHHRAFVFKKLKFNYISVCKIDYFNETVPLRYWFRLLGEIESRNSLRQVIEAMNGNLQQVDNGEALKKILEENRFHCGIQHGDFFASISFHKTAVNDAVNAYHVIEKIQSRLMREGQKLEYIPCQSVQDDKFTNQLKTGEMVIWTPQISKEMVVDAVRKEKRFAPKATRHLIPARPLNVNVPINLFKENISLEEVNMRFSEFLKKKSLRRFAPGQIINGRYYEEELFVFFDDKNSPAERDLP
jgi:hypothetical protein